MNNSRFDKQPSNTMKNKKRFSKSTSFIILGALIAALIGIASLAFTESPTNVVSLAQSQETRKGDKKYIATRNIVVDRETGRTRKPNDKEIKELVDNLREMTKRPTDDLRSAEVAGGGIALDVEGGFAGVMLARPKADGTFETKCVFTFEEGADFLGLVEENL
jgi:hypothetical protein